MDNKERETLREHIVWLGSQLEQERKQNQATVVFLKRVLDPEDLGHAVSHEVRQLAYQLLIENHHIERNHGNNTIKPQSIRSISLDCLPCKCKTISTRCPIRRVVKRQRLALQFMPWQSTATR
jgi:hypothetical protein